MVFYGFSMVFPWFSHCFPTVSYGFLWFSYGFPYRYRMTSSSICQVTELLGTDLVIYTFDRHRDGTETDGDNGSIHMKSQEKTMKNGGLVWFSVKNPDEKP